MALFKVRVSNKIESTIRLEESTAKMLDRYAHFLKSPADEVVESALEYIFAKDKTFQQELSKNPSPDVPATLRVKKIPGAPGNGFKPATTAAK